MDGSLGFNQSENIAKEIYALVAKSVKDKDFIVFTKDTHTDDYLSTREGKFLPVTHCIKGTEGHKLFGQLSVFEDILDPNIVVIEKDTFGSDKICDILEDAFSGAPDVIEFCGVVTNICVISNVVLCMTKFKESKIIVHEDATAALGDMQHHALAVLKGLGVELV